MKKSREKARQRTEEISKKIETLKDENEALEKRMQFLNKELALCKELFRVYNQPKGQKKPN